MGIIVLAGAGGFIGQYFAEHYRKAGWQVRIISRNGPYDWLHLDRLTEALEGADLLVNLAGRSVNCRYTAANRQEIMDSRVTTTNLLGQAMSACESPPALWINASSATYYRHAEDRPMSEAEGEIGSGFSVEVAKAWEDACFAWQIPNVRQVALRIAIVLGDDGGVMTPFRNLVRYGLGGKQGSGRQMFSWLHMEDLQRIVDYLAQHPDLSGVVNAAAPHAVTNAELMRLLRETMGRRIGLPAAPWMLELGARVIGTETELVLKSRWVVPEKLLQHGFVFRYHHLREALSAIEARRETQRIK